MWLPLALISSLLLGLYDVAKKYSLRENAVLPVLFFATVSGSVLFLGLLALHFIAPSLASNFGVGLVSLSFKAHLQIFLKAFIMALAWTCAFLALKHLPLSIVASIRSSAPAWIVIGAIVFFGERLSLQQSAGVLVIFVSYVLLARVGRKEEIIFTRNPFIGFALAATLLGAASALYDKYLLLRYPPLTLQCWLYVYLDLLLGAGLLLGWVPTRLKRTPFQWRASIPWIGIFLAASDCVYFYALAQPEALVSLISVLRRSNVVISFLLGSYLFREQNKKHKSLVILGVIAGILLIALAKKNG